MKHVTSGSYPIAISHYWSDGQTDSQTDRWTEPRNAAYAWERGRTCCWE